MRNTKEGGWVLLTCIQVKKVPRVSETTEQPAIIKHVRWKAAMERSGAITY